ncbi:MAG: hypothetical protein D6744_05850, partial [Planctomycetota bacterium]
YFAWRRNDNGQVSLSTTYATTKTVDDAIEAIKTMSPPWLLWVAFHAPHHPLEPPPLSLATCDPQDGSNLSITRAMLEAADSELSRLLAAAGKETVVFVLGDNGSNGHTVGTPGRAKGSLYEPGVRVPLIVCGPGVVAGVSDGVTAAVDVPATILDLAGAKIPARYDGVSFASTLGGGAGPTRAVALCEQFDPLGAPISPREWRRAAINKTHKLIAKLDNTTVPPGWTYELYNLASDPNESIDLYPPTSPADIAAFTQLSAFLTARRP